MGFFFRVNFYKYFNDFVLLCFNWLFYVVDVDDDIWEDGVED